MKQKKQCKKGLALLLAAIMLFTSIGVPSFAAGETAKLASVQISNTQNFNFNPDTNAVQSAIAEKREVTLSITKQNTTDIVSYTIYKTNRSSNTTIRTLVPDLPASGSLPENGKINVTFEEPDPSGGLTDQICEMLKNAPQMQGKLVALKVTSADGTKEKQYLIHFKRNRPSDAPFEALNIYNIVADTYNYSETNFTYNNIETDNGNPVVITPSFKDAADIVTYSVTGDSQRQDLSVSSGQAITLDGLGAGESIEVTFHIKAGNTFRYNDSNYTLKITRNKQPAVIQSILLDGTKGQYRFDSRVRSYALKTEAEVTFRLTPSIYQNMPDTITYQISGSAISTPVSGNTFSVSIPVRELKTVIITATPVAEDPANKEGSYTFQLINDDLTKEEELEKIDTAIAPIVEGLTADGSWWHTIPYGTPWAAVSLNTLGWHTDKELYRSNPGFDSYLFEPNSERPYTNWPREALGLLATGFTLDELQAIRLGNRETPFDYKQEIMDNSGRSFMDLYVGANPQVYGLIQDKLIEYAGKVAVESDSAEPRQLPDGSYVESHLGGIDGTAMSVAALSIFYEKPGFEDVTASIDRAIAYLSEKQDKQTGNYYYGNVANTESLAQVIVALCSVGIDPNTDLRFLSRSGRGLMDLLIEDWLNKDGFFVHTWELNGAPNGMATEQGLRALAAYRGFVANGKTVPFNIYDTTQVNQHLVQLPATLENISVTGSGYVFDPYRRWGEISVENTSSLTIPVTRNSAGDQVDYTLDTDISGTVAFSGDTGNVALNGLSTGTYTLTLNVVPGDKNNWETGRYILDITVLPQGSQPPAEKQEVRFTLSTDQTTKWNWAFSETVEIGRRDTVWSVMRPLMERHGYTCNIDGSTGYIASITKDGETLGEFTEGRNSGWMYTVNGEFPNVAVTDYYVEDGDDILFFYTTDYKKEDVSWDGPDLKPVVNNSTATVTISVEARTDASGKATASVSAKDMSSALSDVLKAEKTAAEDGKKNIVAEVKLDIKADNRATSVETAIPTSSVREVAKAGNTALTVATPVGNVTFDKKALSTISEGAAGSDIKLGVGKADKSKLSAEQRQAAADRPVFELNLTSGGQTITDFNGGKASVSLPYTLAEGEAAENVCIYYIDGSGKLIRVEGAVYDEKTGLVTFTTGHFSYYAIGYDIPVKFADVKTTDWFYGAVEFAVRNGLFNGTTDTTFGPNTQMTRAMLVTVLYRMDQAAKTVTVSTAATSGPAVTGGAVAAEKTETQSFADVKGGKWYTDAVDWANANGIVTGMGGGLFGTDNNVTREQMAAILYNYAKYKGHDVTKTTDINIFTDAPAVKSWAQDAMKWASAEGLITGRTATTLVPDRSASRAEVAAILKRFVEGIAE